MSKPAATLVDWIGAGDPCQHYRIAAPVLLENKWLELLMINAIRQRWRRQIEVGACHSKDARGVSEHKKGAEWL